MKNVRLFAVAAALGMFASTVAAADSKATVTWSTEDAVIKVDLGDSVILPTVTASYVKADAKMETGSYYALSKDAYEDAKWSFTNGVLSTDPAAYVSTLGYSGLRYAAPGTAAIDEDAFVDRLTGKLFASEEDFFNHLKEEGAVSVTYLEDGAINEIVVETVEKYITNSNKVDHKNVLIFTTKESKKSDAAMVEAVCDYYTTGNWTPNASLFTSVEKTVYTSKVSGHNVPSVIVTDGTDTATFGGQTEILGTEATLKNHGYVVTVETDKKGNYSLAAVAAIGGESKKINVVAKAADSEVSTLGARLTAGVNYTLATTVDTSVAVPTFTTDNLTYLTDAVTAYQAVGTGNTPVDNNYMTAATTSDVLAKVAYWTANADGSYTLNYADPYNNTITVTTAAGKVVTIDKSNAKKYFTQGNVSKMVVDNISLSSLVAPANAAYGLINAEPFVGLVDTTFSYNTFGKYGVATAGYTKLSSYRACTHVAVGPVVYPAATKVSIATATGSDTYNGLNKFGKAGYITFVDVSDVDASDIANRTYAGASRVAQFEIAKSIPSYEYEYTNYITLEDDQIKLTKIEKLDTVAEAVQANYEPGQFIEVVDYTGNDTNYYVLTPAGKKDDLSLTGVWSPSSAKETGVLEFPDGSEVTLKAVQLEKKGAWYPAFETAAALEEAVTKLTGLDTALVGTSKKTSSTFGVWYANYADEYAALTGEVAPTEATYDTEKVAESERKTATVTSDVDSIDFKTAGVKVVTYTAKDADGNELDTNKITVVVAPKYTRTWENGRVKTLKSYYVSNPSQVYADYTYNWSAKTVTYTYYNEDGSVASQGTNNLD